MDTNTVAELIGTTPRKLRQFLRSQGSTFQAVGSGARYDFTERDIPTLNDKFHAWRGSKPKPIKVVATMPRAVDNRRDREVWAEEDAERGGPLILADIRDPAVRAQVRRVAREQEIRLHHQLLAIGLHVTQMRCRAS